MASTSPWNIPLIEGDKDSASLKTRLDAIANALNTALTNALAEAKGSDPLVKIIQGKNGPAPAGATPIIITGRFTGTTSAAANSIILHTFPTPFPNSCAVLLPTTTAGSANNPVVNADQLTKSSVSLVIKDAPSKEVTVSYIAIGW